MALNITSTTKRLTTLSESTISFEGSAQTPHKTRRLFLAAFVSSVCSFCFGTTVSWTDPDEVSVLGHHIYEFKMSRQDWNNISSFLPLGLVVSIIPMGAVLKYLGCKALMYLQILPYIGGWLIVILANNIYLLYAGRFIHGMCGAAVCLAVPVYLDEICQWKYRGFIGCFFFGSFMYGLIFTNLLITVANMQIVACVNLGFTILFVALKIIPESPIRQICKGKLEKARKTLTWLRCKDHDVDEELDVLIKVVNIEVSPAVGFWSELIYIGGLRPVCRGSVLMSLHQAGGGVVIICYLDNIVVDMSAGSYAPCLAWVCFFMGVGHVICAVLIERIGRRPILLISSVIMCGCALYLCCLFKWSISSGWYGITRVIMYLFTASYTMGLGPAACVLNVELILAKARPLGCAIANIFSWLTVFFMGRWLSYPIYYYMIFYFLLVVGLILLLFTIIFVPETKGQSPSTIQRSMDPNYAQYASSDVSSP